MAECLLTFQDDGHGMKDAREPYPFTADNPAEALAHIAQQWRILTNSSGKFTAADFHKKGLSLLFYDGEQIFPEPEMFIKELPHAEKGKNSGRYLLSKNRESSEFDANTVHVMKNDEEFIVWITGIKGTFSLPTQIDSREDVKFFREAFTELCKREGIE